jgi:hypothetical protein
MHELIGIRYDQLLWGRGGVSRGETKLGVGVDDAMECAVLVVL